MSSLSPIGVFDSGYGGLTVLKEIIKEQPGYDYIYLGDNARAPYGPRSFDTVYDYTLQSVKWLFAAGCPLVILACNTASAKALRSIQQQDLPKIDAARRVLGVIRPTAEVIGNYSKSGHIGILGTSGTVGSASYVMEIEKFFPEMTVFQQACPLWVPLVESNEHESPGADFFIKKEIEALLAKSSEIDTMLLACTHYPLLLPKIRKFTPPHVKIVSQGNIVANSLSGYLPRHAELESRLTREGHTSFFTTDSAADFDKHSEIFFGIKVDSTHVDVLR